MNQTQKHTTGKKLLALLLALIMSVSLLPMSVFAADLGTEAPIVEGQTQQDVQQDESSGEEENVDSQEPVEDVQEPTEDVDATDDIATQEGDVAVQAAEINYVTKTGNGKTLDDSTFYRIVHIDCGRKYFSVADLKKIINYAAASNYTHVELAFGNDGLRFLLDDMEVTASGVTYGSDDVKSAIQAGNKAFYDAGTNELIQSEMKEIISYANSKGIGIIPMFDAPGHLQTVVRAMAILGVATNEYTTPTTSGTSVNYAINLTDAASVNFVQALMQKYITYFKGQGCTMFNIAADECGFSNMDADTYTAYAKLVNSMAAMVQNAGMTALAFNDGIYHKNLTTSVAFDTNIAICYWDASTDKYASAATLANDKGFKIINTHNKWYYVPGTVDTAWYGYTWSANYMNGDAKDCTVADGKYTTNVGCMNAIWFDNPDVTLTTDIWGKIEKHIALLSTNNSTYFTKVTPQPEVTIKADKTTLKVGDTVTLTLSSGVEASWSVDKADVIELISTNDITGATSVTATAVGAGTATVTATVDGTEYTQDITVTDTGDVEVTEERTITLTIGQISEKYTQDGHYGNVTDGELKNDAGVVVATYTSKNETGSGVSFTPVTSVSADSSYYIKTTNGYLTATGSTTDDVSQAAAWTWKFNSTSGSYTYGRFQINSSYLCYSNGSFTTVSTTTNTYNTWVRFSNGQFLIYTGSSYSYELTPGTRTEEPAGDITTITFKGVNEGTTTVVIDNVLYTITVTKEDTTNVSALPIQMWITNNSIEATGSNAGTTSGNGWGGDTDSNPTYTDGKVKYINIPVGTADAASSVYSKDGMSVLDALTAAGLEGDPIVRIEWGGTRFVDATGGNTTKQTLAYWSSRVHNSSEKNIQKAWGTDYSNSGTEFNYIRYYGKSWQVSADRVNWTKVTGAGSTGAYSGCTQQLAAYYMIRTEITDEVTTDVADWGKPKGGSEYNSQVTDKNGFVLLDFAVKYESSNTRVPDEFPVSGKTLAYHCTNGDSAVGTQNGTDYRRLNNFRAVNTGEYEVYKVTVTMTNDAAGTELSSSRAQNGYTYDGVEQILWAIDQETLDQSGLDPYAPISGSSTYSGCKIGGDPYIRGIEVYEQHGALITYYIRATVTEDSLHVYYIDEGTGNQFYYYPISVAQGTYFSEQIALNEDTSIANPAWKTNLVNGSVPNIKGNTETVTADLSKMPAIGAQFRYSQYECTHIWRQDGNNLYLYYKFNAAKTFVADFGLPLIIRPEGVNPDMVGKITSAAVGNSDYAKVTIDRSTYVITYTLTSMLNGPDRITATYNGKNLGTGEDNGITFNLSIIPASTVYYEDSFAKFYGSDGVEQKSFNPAPTDGTDTMGTWYVDGNEMSMPDQALEELGNKDNVYGYDPAYTQNNSTTFSMGSAKKVTVNAALDKAPTATFTFKGTGFDIISLTDNNSGAIVVNVKRTDTNTDGYKEYDKNFLVNNYYGYEQVKGENGTITWEVSGNKDPNALYQIPVMKVTGLDYGEYAVTITVGYGKFFDKTDDSQYSFWLDAVRVYNPMGESYDYKSGENNDYESYPQYIKLRDALAEGDATTAGDEEVKAVFIDGGDTADITTYANYGPNNEVYLAKGQAISFKVAKNNAIASIQIGAKAPQGDAKLEVTGATLDQTKTDGTINTATEMYYVLTGAAGQTVTVTNMGTGILSLTNLKVTFTEKTTADLEKLTTLEQTEAVAAVRALFTAPVEPDPEPVTFEPDRFDVSWNRSTVKVGQKATLTVKTSEDVEAITVDGVTIDTYRTRTQRTGWGWNAKKVTYREFTYTVTAAEAGTLDVSVAAVNAEGVSSAAVTATVTVQAASQRPGIGGWLDNIFGRWF